MTISQLNQDHWNYISEAVSEPQNENETDEHPSPQVKGSSKRIIWYCWVIKPNSTRAKYCRK